MLPQVDVGSVASAYDRERSVIRRLRTLAIAVFVLGAAAIIAGQLPGGLCITDREYRVYMTPAGGALSATLVLLALSPGVAVLWRPRWPQILAWIAIDVWGTAVFLAIEYFSQPARAEVEMIMPLWPALIRYACLAAIALGIVVVIPTIRGSHPSPPVVRPPAVPAARVVRR
jgi:hypothetical protein